MADVAPPPGYVEPCTTANVQTSTSECIQCWKYPGTPDDPRCGLLLTPYCYQEVCFSGWTKEGVWCRTKSADAPIVPDAITSQLDAYPPPTVDASTPAVAPSSCAPYTVPVVPPSSTDPGTSADAGTSTATAAGGCSVSETDRTTSILFLVLGGLGIGLSARRRRPSR